MNAHAAFQLAALTSGMFAFYIAAVWRVTGTNQGEIAKQRAIGAAFAGVFLMIAFLGLSLIVK